MVIAELVAAIVGHLDWTRIKMRVRAQHAACNVPDHVAGVLPGGSIDSMTGPLFLVRLGDPPYSLFRRNTVPAGCRNNGRAVQPLADDTVTVLSGTHLLLLAKILCVSSFSKMVGRAVLEKILVSNVDTTTYTRVIS